MHKIDRIHHPGEFILLCARVSKEHQFANLVWRDGPRRRPTILDATTASYIVRIWKASTFGNRRKMLRAIDKVGPVRVATKLMSLLHVVE